VYAFHQAVIGRANFLFGRPCIYSEDFEGLSGAHVAGRRIAPTILLLLPPLALSRSSFPLSFPFLLLPPLALSLSSFLLSFLFLLLLPPAVSCNGPASKQAREHPPLFRESRLRLCESLIGGELEEARGLAIILRQPATTLRVDRISLIGGELVEARGLAIVPPQAAMAPRVEAPEIGLRGRMSLVGGELVEARGLAKLLSERAKGGRRSRIVGAMWRPKSSE